ncbi:MAG: hypothetical protein J3K34DRAFT_132475, partial [Monoraphidium minutum]
VTERSLYKAWASKQRAVLRNRLPPRDAAGVAPARPLAWGRGGRQGLVGRGARRGEGGRAPSQQPCSAAGAPHGAMKMTHRIGWVLSCLCAGGSSHGCRVGLHVGSQARGGSNPRGGAANGFKRRRRLRKRRGSSARAHSGPPGAGRASAQGQRHDVHAGPRRRRRRRGRARRWAAWRRRRRHDRGGGRGRGLGLECGRRVEQLLPPAAAAAERLELGHGREAAAPARARAAARGAAADARRAAAGRPGRSGAHASCAGRGRRAGLGAGGEGCVVPEHLVVRFLDS